MSSLGRIAIVLQASIVAFLCTACATRGVHQVGDKTTVIDDKFNPYTVISGVSVHAYDGLGDTERFWQLRSFIDRQGRIIGHDIYLVMTYDDYPRDPYTAVDDNAQPLRVETLVKEHCPYNRCARTDTIDVKVSEAMLRSRTDTGFEIRVTAQNTWAVVFSITPKMIAAQLDTLAKVVAQSTQPPAAAAASTPMAERSDPPAVASVASPIGTGAPLNPGIGLQMLPQSTSTLTHGNMHGAVIVGVIPDSPACWNSRRRPDRQDQWPGRRFRPRCSRRHYQNKA